MKQYSNKKKIILGLSLIGALAFAGIQTAGAAPRGGGQPGWGGPQYGNCGGYGYGRQPLSEESQTADKKFRNDTVELRKEMATKRAEQHAHMISDNPDAKRVAQLTGEIFDLREQLKSKAEESGLDNVGFRGMGDGRGPGKEFGRGHGRGCNGPRGYFPNQL